MGDPMNDVRSEPPLLLPFLGRFYDRVIPLSWAIIRTTVGLDLVVHGWNKAIRVPAILAAFAGHGSQPSIAFTLTLLGTEFIGGICFTLGLFTRFFAAAAAIEMAVITFWVYWPSGFTWVNRGYEFTLVWGLVLFAVALRGGGPYSIDRRLGRQL
jgi:putative oxidoreductase